MLSYSPSLLRALTIACCIAATTQAGAQRAEPAGVRPVASDSAVMEGPLDPCVARTAACAYPPSTDRCESPAYRAVSRTAAAGTFVGAQAILWRYFENAWWSGDESKGFFFRADWDDNFRDQDKFGHLFGGYHLTRIGAAVLENACISPGKAVALSAIYATLFQLQIELWDAKFEKYGFSYPDLLANTAGMAYAVAQHKYPTLQRIKPTISYSRSAAMRARDAGRLPDSEVRESLDYSGQTYWFSTEVDAFLPEAARPFWPDVLRFSVGHSITDWIDPETGHSFRARRKILLSLDFDASKLPGNHPLWRTVKNTLSYIRLPAPALQITPSFDVIGWYR
ncbi:MAG: YfiM family protein [Gemmatimonadota bacterium]|nr:YfiM family protein [Gemmatimonadota bacterium]